MVVEVVCDFQSVFVGKGKWVRVLVSLEDFILVVKKQDPSSASSQRCLRQV
jgi:hypothetical protein